MSFDPKNPKPGRYDDLDIEEYHKGPGISRSALKVLEEGTPRDLLHYRIFGIKETDAMRLGSAVDMMLFEPERVPGSIIVRPTWGRKKADLEERAAWEAEHEGDLILTQPQWDSAIAIVTAARDAESVRALMREIEPQPSYYWERDGVLVKARPDAISNGYSWDLKTTADMSERKRWNAIIDYGYDAQAAMVREGMLSVGDEWKGHIILWAGKSEPHDIHLQLIEKEDIVLELGEKRWEKWLSIYAECERTGRWPGRSHLIGKMRTPKWIAYKLEEETEAENRRLRKKS